MKIISFFSNDTENLSTKSEEREPNIKAQPLFYARELPV